MNYKICAWNFFRLGFVPVDCQGDSTGFLLVMVLFLFGLLFASQSGGWYRSVYRLRGAERRSNPPFLCLIKCSFMFSWGRKLCSLIRNFIVVDSSCCCFLAPISFAIRVWKLLPSEQKPYMQAVLQISHFIQAGKWHTLYSTIYLLLTPCLGVLFVYDSFALC